MALSPEKSFPEQTVTEVNHINNNHPGSNSSRLTNIDLVALAVRLLEKIHWILISAILGAVITGVFVNYVITPVYEATSKIYIVGSDNTISLADLQISSNLAADYQEVFKNWHVHELVDQKLQMDYSYSQLAGMVKVSNPPNTHILYVTVSSQDPDEAQLLADTYSEVVKEFIATKMDMREPNIFEQARRPSAPVSPKTTRDIIIGFLTGALLAMVVIILRFLNDDRIRSSEDIAKAGELPTLGMVPLQEEKQTPASADTQKEKKE